MSNSLPKGRKLMEEIPELAGIHQKLVSLVLDQARKGLLGERQSPNFYADLQDLLEQRKQILERRGLSEDDFQPEYECPRCKDQGFYFENGEYRLCSCELLRIQQKRYRFAQISERMRKQRFSNFNLSYYRTQRLPGPLGERGETEQSNAKKILDACYEFTERIIQGETELSGLFLTGEVGVGKTHLVSAIANRLIDSNIVPVYAVVADLLTDIKSTYDHENKTNLTETELMDKVRRIDVLLLDDLGVERATGWVAEKLFSLLNYRYLHRKPVVITSNYDLDELDEFIGRRIASRIIEMCRPFKLYGPDVRWLIRKESRG